MTNIKQKTINSWDKGWEKLFQNQEWGKYPPEELVRFTARNFYKAPNRKSIKFLDLGCGTGAGAWYLAREGFSVFGIDGSETAISIAKKRFKKENLDGEFKKGDIVSLDYPAQFFDCLIDIFAIQHNTMENQKKILQEVLRVLKPNGRLFSMLVGDKTRFNKPNAGQKLFTRFLKKEEINDLFSGFKNLAIEISQRTDRDNFLSYFIISGEKNEF